MFDITREQRIVVLGLLISIGVGGLLYLIRGFLPSQQEHFQVQTPLQLNGPVARRQSPGAVLVHITGQVQRPGVYRLSAGDRVFDAIQLAGGVTPQANLSRLRLAAQVKDGQTVYVSSSYRKDEQKSVRPRRSKTLKKL